MEAGNFPDLHDLLDVPLQNDGDTHKGFDDFQVDFQNGPNGKPIHIKSPYDSLTLDRLKDTRYNPKQTPRANLRKFLASVSIPFRNGFIQCPTWKDFAWFSSGMTTNPAFFTDALHDCLATFERACFADPNNSILP